MNSENLGVDFLKSARIKNGSQVMIAKNLGLVFLKKLNFKIAAKSLSLTKTLGLDFLKKLNFKIAAKSLSLTKTLGLDFLKSVRFPPQPASQPNFSQLSPAIQVNYKILIFNPNYTKYRLNFFLWQKICCFFSLNFFFIFYDVLMSK